MKAYKHYIFHSQYEVYLSEKDVEAYLQIAFNRIHALFSQVCKMDS